MNLCYGCGDNPMRTIAAHCTVLRTIERWKRYGYANLPGKQPTWEEFKQLTNEIVRWLGYNAQHIWGGPLTTFVFYQELIMQGCEEIVPEREGSIQFAWGMADSTCNQIKDMANHYISTLSKAKKQKENKI